MGFYQPRLIGALDAIGVHVANVIKLCSEHTETSEGKQEPHTCEGNEGSLRASPVLDTGKRPSVNNMHYSITDLISSLISSVCARSRGSWWCRAARAG